MSRPPRNREDHLVTGPLIAQAYGFVGFIEFWGALFCYYVIANDFGFKPG